MFFSVRNKINSLFTSFFVLIAFFLFISSSFAQNNDTLHLDTIQLTESQVKAVYLFNFANEIEWPDINDIDTITIAILSHNTNVYSILKKAESKKYIKGKPLKVIYSSDLDSLLSKNPQILYVSKEFNSNIKNIFGKLYNRHILLVTDQLKNFIYTMINFYVYKDKLLYKIYTDNLQNAGLVPSEQLLAYGGSAYDIMDVFKQKEKELKLAKLKLDIERKRLDSLQRSYIQQESLYIAAQMRYERELSIKEDSVNKVHHTLDSMLIQLKQREAKLEQSKRQLHTTKVVIERLKKEIAEKADFYNKQLEKIKLNESIIKKQQQSIAQYKQKVTKQSRRIFYMLVIIVLLVIFTLVVIKLYVDNRTMALQLENSNKEIAAQAEEQAQLIEELEKLSIVARETDNVVYLINPDGKIIWINEAFEKKYKFPLDSILGKNIMEVATIGSHKIAELFNKCILEHKSVEYETSFVTADGKRIWIQVTLTPVVDREGNVERVVAIDTDITKVKEAQRKIEVINKMLVEQQRILMEQKEEIEEKSKVIQSSLEYALTIQNAILPKDETIKKYFSESYVIFKPLQIVSGDFYWLGEPKDNSDYIYVVVADGTGHGVPGAFISLITERLLDEAVYMLKIKEPKDILKYLDNEIDNLIVAENESETPLTGVDMALVRIKKLNDEQFEVTFSGAKRPVVYYLPNALDLEYFKTSRRSISNPLKIEYESDYEQYTVIVPKETIFYLYTDGYIDQNCANESKRIGSKNFLNLLWNIRNFPLKRQKEILEDYLKLCLSRQQQRDDITVWLLQL